jgi:hypothetical protein
MLTEPQAPVAAEAATGRPSRHGAWLIPIGIAALLSGGILALPGVILSRWLRPLSKPGLLGYFLCWLSVTFAPIAIYYLSADTLPVLDRLWPPAVYLVSAAIWLVLRRKFIGRPSRTIGRAFLAAIAGSLLLAPGIFLGGQIVVLLPQIACLILNVGGWLSGGQVLPPLLVLEPMVLMTLPAFVCHLAAHWPARRPKAKN